MAQTSEFRECPLLENAHMRGNTDLEVWQIGFAGVSNILTGVRVGCSSITQRDFCAIGDIDNLG
jgi:hypothetical protein